MKSRILLIDDDDEFRLMFKEMLERANYEVFDINNGKEGINFYRSNPTDLIITDIVMPEKEGIETIINLMKEFSNIKIIAISGGGRSGPQNYLETAKLLGAKYSFTKPFQKEDILKAIESCIGK